jgi:hypothetical protein
MGQRKTSRSLRLQQAKVASPSPDRKRAARKYGSARRPTRNAVAANDTMDALLTAAPLSTSEVNQAGDRV